MNDLESVLIAKIALGAIFVGAFIGAIFMREYLLTKFDLKRK